MMNLSHNIAFTLASSQYFPSSFLRGVQSSAVEQMPALDYARQGYLLFAEAKYKEALDLYTMAIAQYADQPFFFACRSLINAILEDEEGAFYDYQVAKKLDFNYHIFLEYLETEPSDTFAMVRFTKLKEGLELALEATQQFDYLRAIQLYSYALSDYQAPVEVYVYRAALYVRLLMYDRAMADYQAALTIDPLQVDAYIGRAKLYQAVGAQEEALADYAKVDAIDADNSLLFEERGAYLLSLERYELALADYDRLVDASPEDFYVYALRADVHEKLENWNLAIEDYTMAITYNPYYSDLFKYRAELRAKVGDQAGAHADMLKFDELEEDY